MYRDLEYVPGPLYVLSGNARPAMDRSELDKFIQGLEDAAYRRGFDDAIAKMKQAVESMSPTRQEIASKPVEKPVRLEPVRIRLTPITTEAAPIGVPPREGSDQDKVLQAIRLLDGVRGVDISNVLSKEVNERTVRTALHRLKNRQLIEKRGDLWFPTEGPKEKEDQPVKG